MDHPLTVHIGFVVNRTTTAEVNTAPMSTFCLQDYGTMEAVEKDVPSSVSFSPVEISPAPVPDFSGFSAELAGLTLHNLT